MDLRKFEYGHGNALMILVAEQMGLSPALVDEAKRTLEGVAIHAMTAAAIEKEAIRVNDLVRHDPEVVAQANAHAELLKAQYGFTSTAAKPIPKRTSLGM